MGICQIIGSLIAAAFVLVGSALLWRAIDDYDDAHNLDKYEKMAYRYDIFGIFFVGILTLLYAFLSNKFPNFCGMGTLIVIGIVYYIIMDSVIDSTTLNGYRLQYQCDKDAASDFDKKFLGGGLLAYLGFILAILSLGGVGFNDSYKALKIVFLLATTACAIISIFLIATSDTSTLSSTPPLCNYIGTSSPDDVNDSTGFSSANVPVVTVTFYIWFLALTAVLSGNHDLAAGVGVVFGAVNFFILQILLRINDSLDSVDDEEAKKTRSGYAFAWFTGFTALLTAITVYATPRDDAIKA